MAKLSHYGKKGEVRMVDVSEKAVTTRTAAARGLVKMQPRVVNAVRRLKNPKGNPLEVARIAESRRPRGPRSGYLFVTHCP